MGRFLAAVLGGGPLPQHEEDRLWLMVLVRAANFHLEHLNGARLGKRQMLEMPRPTWDAQAPRQILIESSSKTFRYPWLPGGGRVANGRFHGTPQQCEQGRETALPCFALPCLGRPWLGLRRIDDDDDDVVVVIVYWTAMKQADGGPQQLTASNAIVYETSQHWASARALRHVRPVLEMKETSHSSLLHR